MLGLIAKKIGMTQVFDELGVLVPVTVLETGPCRVLELRPESSAVVMGFGKRRVRLVSRALASKWGDAGQVPRYVRQFRASGDASLQVGQILGVGDVFAAGGRVDVAGTTKGRGYAGVIKRHGFAGFPGSHGTHEYFRHGGSIGNRSYPGRVFKGRRMAGQMGATRRTTQNLRIVGVRPEENLLLVRGSIPGPRNGVVTVVPSVKGARHGG